MKLFIVLWLVQLACCDNLPNIVILLADDLGYGDLSMYGHPTSTNPNLEKMASEGLVFKQFYSAANICSASRAALLTGRYQTRSGVYYGQFWPFSQGGLPLNETTIAEGLKSKGYYTAIIGKWHLGVGENQEYLPTNQGFDSYFGIPYSHNMCPLYTCFSPNIPCLDVTGIIPCRNVKLNMEQIVGCPVLSDNTIVQQPADLPNLTNSYVAKAIEAINKANAASSPFFLYFAFSHVHSPQFAGEKWTTSSIRGSYGDALNELDWAVGEIFQALKDANVDDNTFVFFTSDNGPEISASLEIRGGNAGLLRCGKSTTWEGGMRVPAIAWWPGKISPGVTREFTATLDIFPTLMKLAGVELPQNVTLDGVDMSPVLFKNEPSYRESLMYYSMYASEDEGVHAVRWRQYKAHFYIEGGEGGDNYPDIMCRANFTEQVMNPPLLYDLDRDPSEYYPLNTSLPIHADIVEHMTRMKRDFDANMVWGIDEIEKGYSLNAELCAMPGCSPFPSCCSTYKVWPHE